MIHRTPHVSRPLMASPLLRASAVALGLVLALPLTALAQPRDPAAAEALFARARERMAQKDYAAACPMLAESQRLDPAAGTLLNLADCEEHAGDLASAWAHWRAAIEQLPAKDEALPIAKRRLEALEARVPRLTLRLAPGAPPGTRVLRDGIEVASAAMGVPLVVNPGAHIIVVTAPGRQERQETPTLREGERREMIVSVGAEIATAPPPLLGPTPVEPPAPKPSFWGQHKASILTMGAGALLAGAGAGVSAKALSDHTAFAAMCSTKACNHADGAGVRTDATVATVLFAAAGAAGVTSVVLFFTVERSKPSTSVALVPLGAGAGVLARF